MAEKFLMKNEAIGQAKNTFIGYSWTMLFFNAFAPLFRGDFKTFLALAACNVMVYVLSPNILFYGCVSFMPGFIWSFFWNKSYTDRLLKNGYVFAEGEDRNAYAIGKLNTRNTAGYVFCAIYCFANLIIAFNLININGIEKIFAEDDTSADVKHASLSDIEDATPAGISPYGELADIFNLGSDYTDLQREDILKKIKGKIIEWELPVYEVKREGNEYNVIFNSSGKTVGVVAVFNNPGQGELAVLKAVKTGERFKFRGIIKGTWMRSILVDPAKIMLPESNQIILRDRKMLSKNFSFPYSSLNSLISKANKGDSQAAYRAGVLLYNYSGNGDYGDNIKKSLRYLKKAENDGIVYARAMRTRIEYDRAASDHDLDEMEKWEKEAQRLIKVLKPLCDEGIGEAQYMTGRLYIGVLNNYDLGMPLYRNACENKSVDACRFLGNIYKHKDNFEEAQKYYELCVSNGEPLCKEYLSSLQAKKNNFQKNGIQMTVMKLEGVSGSEESGEIYGRDERNNEISFSYAYENSKVDAKVEKMKEGKTYNIKYKITYFNDRDPSQGHYKELVDILPGK